MRIRQLADTFLGAPDQLEDGQLLVYDKGRGRWVARSVPALSTVRVGSDEVTFSTANDLTLAGGGDTTVSLDTASRLVTITTNPRPAYSAVKAGNETLVAPGPDTMLAVRGDGSATVTIDPATNELVIDVAETAGFGQVRVGTDVIQAAVANALLDLVGSGNVVVSADPATNTVTFSLQQGSGSGLDADTVDGLHASAFLQNAITNIVAGSTSITSSGSQQITLSAGSGISISGNNSTKTITIAASGTSYPDLVSAVQTWASIPLKGSTATTILSFSLPESGRWFYVAVVPIYWYSSAYGNVASAWVSGPGAITIASPMGSSVDHYVFPVLVGVFTGTRGTISVQVNGGSTGTNYGSAAAGTAVFLKIGP